MKLFNIDANAKTVKGQKKGYLTAILYLAPANLSGRNVCPMATPGCISACLNTAGRGAFSTTQMARIKKTNMFFERRAQFMLQAEKEIVAFIKRAHKLNLIPTVRMNGTSDIKFENISFVAADGKMYRNIMERFPDIQFYDYTKHPIRNNLPKNYKLTFSLAENNEDHARKAIENKMNIAVVFRKPDFPKKYLGLKVIDGDETDLRFLDPKNSIVGLKAKGRAKRDLTGFVKEV